MAKNLFFFSLLLGCLILVRPGAAQVVQYLPPLVAARAVPPGLVGVSQVVDARPGRPMALGYSLSGGAGPQPVTFAQPLAPTLLAFLQQQVPPSKTPGQELVMRLTRLELEELKLQTLAHLEAEFYRMGPDSSYQLVARCAEAAQRPLTGKREAALVAHSQNLSDVLLGALGTGGNLAQWLPNEPRRVNSQLRAAEPAPPTGSRWPILAEGATRRAGFYRTFDDFRNNQPTEADRLEVERHPNSNAERADDYGVTPYYHEANGRRRPATIYWGFSDGQHAYIQFDFAYHRLLPQLGGFMFYTPPKLRGYGVPAYGTAALTRERYELNLDTGTGTPFLPTQRSLSAQHLPNPLSRPTQLLVYRPRSAKGPAAQIRLAPDQPAQSLAAGEYLQFSPLAGQPLTVRIQLAGGMEVTLPVLPTAETAVYLECRPGQDVPLQQVKVEVGAAAVSRLID
ncbi:hypothetical protein QMK33_21635 [Hymenobacter sp. H14-R3]|uniref:hypothetical protein n=1 Tax=Hymenobacter sp. H14-R3 TaxID=3046308 RepID=UPI0024B8B2AC|nr:hypothetical protein [Hymenobacter sp. H14-R3]MDJ0367756.1 hypothetical protein [Hymenobacter sp. H14-R3]